jgi:TolA-binding protein
MKTVKQIADEIGVNVQTVYRRINKVKQNTNENLTDKVDGIAYFTEVGEKLIIESLTNGKQILNNVKQAESGEILFLREQIKELNSKNDELLKQIDKLTTHAENLSRLNENSQLLLAQQKIESLPSPEKINFWNRIFKRK